jgi:hypothetical protein
MLSQTFIDATMRLSFCLTLKHQFGQWDESSLSEEDTTSPKWVRSGHETIARGCVPRSGVGAVDKWPAVATVQSQAEAGHFPTAVVIADLR